MRGDGGLSQSKKRRQLLLYWKDWIIHHASLFKKNLQRSPGQDIGFVKDEATYAMWRPGCHFSFPAVHNRPCELDCFLPRWLVFITGAYEWPRIWKGISLNRSMAVPFVGATQTEVANTLCFCTAALVSHWGCQLWILLAMVNRNVTRQMDVYIYLGLAMILFMWCGQ